MEKAARREERYKINLECESLHFGFNFCAMRAPRPALPKLTSKEVNSRGKDALDLKICSVIVDFDAF